MRKFYIAQISLVTTGSLELRGHGKVFTKRFGIPTENPKWNFSVA